MGFLGSSDGKDSACNMGDMGSLLGWEDLWKREGYPLQYSCLKSQEQRSLVDYS